MADQYIKALVNYALEHGLIDENDRVYCTNALLFLMRQPGFDPDTPAFSGELFEILNGLCDIAVQRGLCGDTVTERDLFDTALMGAVTPRPSQVIADFQSLCRLEPAAATDYFYTLSGDTNYIRRDRIRKMRKWTYDGAYGTLDITVNLAKPEKDPKAIAAAGKQQATGYPKCQLCRESEGYAGRLDYPARQNHRVIPLSICGENWFLQYSPYVYYNEHCIVLNSAHTPMRIDKKAFEKLLDFVSQFPHYFVGSNADLPIVGGSILSHEHFQGGRYVFPMERAEIEKSVTFEEFPDVTAGIVKWPMSTLRLQSRDPQKLALLAGRILTAWRAYSDADVFVFSETNGVPHNTITPIARRRGELFELDLVLRNNITTEEHPLGVYHPHAELHHIKKENIGLIEVMGLAVLPGRLEKELATLEAALANGADLSADPLTASHAAWAQAIKEKYPDLLSRDIGEVLRAEVGAVFEQVLEHAGVFKRDASGRAAFDRFIASV